MLHGFLPRRPGSQTFIDTCLHGNRLIYVLLKHRTDLFQFLQSQFLNGNIPLQAVQNQLSHDTVGIPERHAVIYQIIRCVCGIRKSLCCALPHPVRTEFYRGQHSVKQRQASFYRINGIKGQFLVFLHVFIVSQRQSFHGSKQGYERPVHPAGLSTYQLGDIRIFLLGHNAAARTVCVVQLHELVFVGIPYNNFFPQTA